MKLKHCKEIMEEIYPNGFECSVCNTLVEVEN